jgi:sugar phosphate isomerase/epimerase
MFFHDHTLDRIFSAVALSGADTLEFWPETPDWWLDGLPVERLKQALEKHPFPSPLSVHAPVLDLNPCSVNPDVAEISISWILYTLSLAEELGAAVCTIHPGRRTSKRPPSGTDYRRLDHMLDSIAPVARRSRVKVAIENMEPRVNALLSTPGEISRLLDERDWLYFTLDTCHVSAHDLPVLQDFIDSAGDRIGNVHLSGAAGGVMHQPASGDEWAMNSLELLLRSGYDGPVTLEINDLAVDRPLTFEEKISILAADVATVRECTGSGRPA